MNVTLTPEMERMVADRLATGHSATATQVVQEALKALEERDLEDAEELARFTTMMQQSEDEVERGEVVDPDEMFARLRERGRLMRQAAA